MIYIQVINVSINRGFVCTYLEYHINEGLGIIPEKVLGHLGLIALGKYFREQGCALVGVESMADQLLPGR